MTITLRQMEIFEKVANCGHVTKVGQQVFLTQSAVSMSIAELEKFADAQLFERKGKRLLLNDRGRLILKPVREVLRQVSAIEQQLIESVGKPMGILKVGASTTIGNYLLPTAIASFMEQYPKARALLQVGNTVQIEQALENGSLDVGIVEGPFHVQSLQSTFWRRDELVVIVGKSHPWAKKRKATKAMLEKVSWIAREKGSGTREVFETAMKKKNIRWTTAMELGHTEAIKKAVEAGLGVGCLSRMCVARELLHGWLTEVGTPLDLRRNLTILVREGGHHSTLLNAFLSSVDKYR